MDASATSQVGTTRVALVGQGVGTARLLRAFQEFGRGIDRRFRTVAVVAPRARGSWVDRYADEVATVGGGGPLDLEALTRTLEDVSPQMVGMGSQMPRPWLGVARLCEARGWTFVGPPAATLEALLDPVQVRRIAERVGVSTVPWSGGPVETLEQARAHADRLGYPVLCRSAASSRTGFGVAASAAGLPGVFARAQQAALASGAHVLLERYLSGVRRFEVPVLSDGAGHHWALDVIDASVRRVDGSVLAQAPAVLSDATIDRIQQTAARLARAFEHRHVGTMAFLHDPVRDALTFISYDLCCGGELAAVEALRGIDLAKIQIRLALGETLDAPPPDPRGAVAVAPVRVRPIEGERPVLERMVPATGPGVRTDVAASTSDRLVAGSPIAEIVAWGWDRGEALGRLQQALSRASLLVRGGETTLGMLRRALAEPALWEGPVDCDWLAQRIRSSGPYTSRIFAPIAVLQAAIEAYDQEQGWARQMFEATARRGRPEAAPCGGRKVELEHEGHLYVCTVRAVGPGAYQVEAEGLSIPVRIEHRGGREHRLQVADARYRVVSARSGFTHTIEVEGETHRVRRDRSGVVRSEVPAIVSALHVQEGDEVREGQKLAVLEVMKTELSLHATFGGRVRQVMIRANEQVAAGTPLVWIAPGETPAVEPATDRLKFDSLASPKPVSAVECFETALLGYDIPPEALQAALRDHGKHPDDDDPERQLRILERFLALLRVSPLDADRESAADGGLELSPREYLRSYLQDVNAQGSGLPPGFLTRLHRLVAAYGIQDLEVDEALWEALCRSHMALARQAAMVAIAVAILARQGMADAPAPPDTPRFRNLIDRVVARTQSDLPQVCELARTVRYRVFDGPMFQGLREQALQSVDAHIEALVRGAPDRDERMAQIVDCPLSLFGHLLGPQRNMDPAHAQVALEALVRRFHRVRPLKEVRTRVDGRHAELVAGYAEGDGERRLLAATVPLVGLEAGLQRLSALATSEGPVAMDLYLYRSNGESVPSAEDLVELLNGCDMPAVDRVVVAVGPDAGASTSRRMAYGHTFRRIDGAFAEDRLYRGLHPMVAERLEISRLANFELERLESSEDVYVFSAIGRDSPEDRRVFVYADVRDLSPVLDDEGQVIALPQLERTVGEALSDLRSIRASQKPRERTEANRLELFVWPRVDVPMERLWSIVHKLAPATVGLGLEQVRFNVPPDETDGHRRVLVLSNPDRQNIQLTVEEASGEPVPIQTRYEQKVLKLRRRGLVYPYELVRFLTPKPEHASPDLPPGEFIEYDLSDNGVLEPVDRPPGQNTSNIITGLIRTFTDKVPEGMARVALLGDPSRAMGSLAEPECRRIMAALDLAESMDVPVEWYAVSAGAEISKERGTENMDWIAAVLRRIIEFTQAGRELNIVVCGINVGAQPYWNAEATMLMHTKGVLVMVPGVAMVLTGKQALDYSGGVSADDNLGIGGYEQIMGPNGQAQYFAPDLVSAGKILLRYYAHTYRVPGERYPRPRPTTDPADRDVCHASYGPADGLGFETVGQVFSIVDNPGRKRPFDIRRVMGALVDRDAEPLERWRDMRDAETVVVWDAHLGGQPVSLLGIESRPIRRLGHVPADGPISWTGGTLFPRSSKKAARAINAASGNRPLVILANLTGFDGSPESLRQWQLEFGAEIGRAVVNFDGPIAFSVVSRFHGGAFVVFSNRLNDRMETIALDGTHASVIGGAPAAAVVFARELESRVEADPDVKSLGQALEQATGAEKAWLSVRLQQTRDRVRSERLGELANEYDAIHSVERARQVGSVHTIIAPERLRPVLIDAVKRGMAQSRGASA